MSIVLVVTSALKMVTATNLVQATAMNVDQNNIAMCKTITKIVLLIDKTFSFCPIHQVQLNILSTYLSIKILC
jgi:prenyltransferase beta subunit